MYDREDFLQRRWHSEMAVDKEAKIGVHEFATFVKEINWSSEYERNSGK